MKKFDHRDFLIKNGIFWIVLLLLADLSLNPIFSVSVDALKEPMQNLKKEMFGGWMFAVKIAACVTGAAFSVFKQSLSPLGVGGAIGAGIHFFDKWIGDGSTALI